MDSSSKADIDDLARRIEHLITENQDAIAKFDSEFTPASESEENSTTPMEDVDPAELFS